MQEVVAERVSAGVGADVGAVVHVDVVVMSTLMAETVGTGGTIADSIVGVQLAGGNVVLLSVTVSGSAVASKLA
jgi:hypothetical protein